MENVSWFSSGSIEKHLNIISESHCRFLSRSISNSLFISHPVIQGIVFETTDRDLAEASVSIAENLHSISYII